MNAHFRNQNFSAFLVGLIFAIGLALAGMTQPQKVIGFLNPFAWDPSLLFVMIGAIGVHAASYPLIRRRSSPLLDTRWHVPTRKDLTPRLIVGSALFGVGWGLAGYCPGPALTSLGGGSSQSIVFVLSLILGMVLFRKTEVYLRLRG